MNKGIFYAASAYIAWGFLPIFWKALHAVPALENLAQRIVWGLAVAVVLVAYRSNWRWLGEVFRSKRTMLTFVTSSLLLSVNWFVYIWAVNAGYIVETSLGYCINPLLNVLLGVLFLKERLRVGQGVAVALALAGVLYLTVQYGAPPWIALALATSFGAYGLLRKTATLGSLEGFTLEALLLFPLAVGYVLYLEVIGSGAFVHTGVATSLLLVCGGFVTAATLLLFAAGARRITLISLGILQYVAPTIQFLLGVLVYGEALSPQRLVGFCVIWLALAIYTLEAVLRNGRAAQACAVAIEP
jgi:chloramphenicol-sensitive protein RarD